MIALLEKLQWWNLSIGQIKELVPLLTCPDIERVKRELKIRLDML